MKLRRRLVTYSVAITVAASGIVAVNTSPAAAHGVNMFPGARTFLCWQDGLRDNGAIQPYNPACAAAVQQSGPTPLYNWFAVLRSDANGRTTGFIPDGQICSGGTGGPYDFRAYNAARTDWPVTHVTSGASYQFRYSNWAAHPGDFRLYMTREGWNPASPLAWGDLVPFATVTNPPQNGGPGGLNYYFWNQQLPQRTGRHILYIQWVRSDSQENFFSCSDVVFDGGNGQVTGVGPNQTQPPPTNNPTTNPPTNNPTTNPPTNNPTTNPPGNGACTAAFRTINSWGGGYQAAITVRAGTSAVNGWTVRFTTPSGQTVGQLWNGTMTASGSNIQVKNVSWNGNLAANATAEFGYLVNGSGSPAANSLTCSSP